MPTSTMPTDHQHRHNSWIVVNTHPHREAFAIQNLARQGFGAYCPMINKRIRHARRSYDAARPLFPSYVFVEQHQGEQNWRPIFSTYGVRTIICNGDTPAGLSAAFIDALKLREINGTVCKPENPYTLGDKVAIQGGALDGFVGEIVEMRGRERVAVLLNLLSGRIKAQVATSELRRA